MKALFSTLLLSAAASAIETTSSLRAQFLAWAAQHGKTYATSDEFEMRMQVFAQTDREIREAYEQNPGLLHGTLDFNVFSDRTAEEMGAYRNGDPAAITFAGEATPAFSYRPNADSEPFQSIIDYCGETENKCNPVQDQGDCKASGGAFATVAAMETTYAESDLIKLSEQQIIDCDDGGYKGCESNGLAEGAYGYAQDHPIALEEQYLYTGRKGDCRVNLPGKHLQIHKVKDINNQSAKAVKVALSDGPVVADIDSSCTYFKNYSKDIVNASCDNTTVDHAVLIVGYGEFVPAGVQPPGNNHIYYFIVRNSWGTAWGLEGYMYLGFQDDYQGMGNLGILSKPRQIIEITATEGARSD